MAIKKATYEKKSEGKTRSGKRGTPRESLSGIIPVTSTEGDFPALPEPIPDSPEIVNSATLLNPEISAAPAAATFLLRKKYLKQGCYLLQYSPKLQGILPLYHYDGTMRIQRHGSSIGIYPIGATTASGDLYIHQKYFTASPSGTVERKPAVASASAFSTVITTGAVSSQLGKISTEPNPANGIPVFPISRYRYYIAVTNVSYGFGLTLANPVINISAKSSYYVNLEFDLYKYDSVTRTWPNKASPEHYTTTLWYTTAPVGYPDPTMYLEGDVFNTSGEVVARLSMGWVSSHYRRAVIEVDKVTASEWNLNNGAGETWETVFDKVGWQVTAIQSNADIAELGGTSWSDAELHAGMLAWRESADLDTQWRYHILCVQFLDSTTRGIMYDAFGTDSNNVPREGAAESSHWVMHGDGPANWGLCEGNRFGQCAKAYFRAGVHEIGHAILLYHPFLLPSSVVGSSYSTSTDNHIMQVSPTIAENAIVAGVQFPTNIEWDFAPWDHKYLKHLPDISVRPGGVPFQIPTTQPIISYDAIVPADWLDIEVSSLHETVPLGAPVRINVNLKNTTDKPVHGPVNLNIKYGCVSGKVMDSSGTERTFSPVARYLDNGSSGTIMPGESLSDSLTLLRGKEGALFPAPGTYRVVVTIIWSVDGLPFGCSGETRVIILPPENSAHAKAAYTILSTPDTHLSIAIGGDHLEDGIRAVQEGLENPKLRAHYAYIEAKRLGSRFGKRKPDLKAAAALLDDSTVMSPAEIRRTVKILKDAGKDAPADAVKQIARVLKSKLDTVNADNNTREMVRSL